ncbi:quinolinate synthase NadA [Candidatus Micrarchaeota archaeon]|nr:quinolinate synthase NadA [Candidatus Micrarchaeota archaeon]
MNNGTSVQTVQFTQQEIKEEAERLFSKLSHLDWTMDICLVYAPITLEINRLKKEKNAILLAHSYQTPDIVYGIADFVGDSYGLSKKAQETSSDVILFSGVVFMAETAKIINPTKTVLVPARDAGCSLSDSITGEDVKKLKARHPNAPVICYVNTSAEVKAESDICCTSANALKIVQSLPDKEIIFIPDQFMAQNIAKLTDKKIISWDGYCIVHKDFTGERVDEFRKAYPDLKILAHTECSPSVIDKVDLAGGTEDMVKYVKASDSKKFMLITECGLADRMRVEHSDKEFIGMCNLCPYMKKNNLLNILQALKNPKPEQIVTIPEETRKRAERSLQRMFELTSN